MREVPRDAGLPLENTKLIMEKASHPARWAGTALRYLLQLMKDVLLNHFLHKE